MSYGNDVKELLEPMEPIVSKFLRCAYNISPGMKIQPMLGVKDSIKKIYFGFPDTISQDSIIYDYDFMERRKTKISGPPYDLSNLIVHDFRMGIIINFKKDNEIEFIKPSCHAGCSEKQILKIRECFKECASKKTL